MLMEMLLDQSLVPHFPNLVLDQPLEDNPYLPHLHLHHRQTHLKALYPAKELPQLRIPTLVKTGVLQVQVNHKVLAEEQEEVNPKEQPTLLLKPLEQVQSNSQKLLLNQPPQLELKTPRVQLTPSHQHLQELKAHKGLVTPSHQLHQELKTPKLPLIPNHQLQTGQLPTLLLPHLFTFLSQLLFKKVVPCFLEK